MGLILSIDSLIFILLNFIFQCFCIEIIMIEKWHWNHCLARQSITLILQAFDDFLLLFTYLLAFGEVRFQFSHLDFHHPVFFKFLLLFLTESFIVIEFFFQIADFLSITCILELNFPQILCWESRTDTVPGNWSFYLFRWTISISTSVAVDTFFGSIRFQGFSWFVRFQRFHRVSQRVSVWISALIFLSRGRWPSHVENWVFVVIGHWLGFGVALAMDVLHLGLLWYFSLLLLLDSSIYFALVTTVFFLWFWWLFVF